MMMKSSGWPTCDVMELQNIRALKYVSFGSVNDSSYVGILIVYDIII